MRPSRCAGAVNALQRLQRLLRAEPRRVGDHHLGEPDDGVERRAQLVAHAGDELRFVLARQFELAALVLDLVQQARVLDRDDRLVCEARDQFDLLVGEGPHFLAVDADDADKCTFLEHRHAENSAVTAACDGSDDKRIALDVCPRRRDIGDLGGLPHVGCGPKAGVGTRMDHRGACLGECRRRVVHRPARNPWPSQR